MKNRILCKTENRAKSEILCEIEYYAKCGKEKIEYSNSPQNHYIFQKITTK
jgi:hypothetical protein